MAKVRDGSSARTLSDLRVRTLSASILGPLVLLVAWLGGPIFGVLMAAGGVIFLSEWQTIVGAGMRSVSAFVGYFALVVSVLLFFYGLPWVSLAVLVAGAVISYFVGGQGKAGLWSSGGVLFSIVATLSLIAARQGDLGRIFIFFLFFTVWGTDIGAYFAGRRLGGPKLWPRVSPKKTWSGAIGGLIIGAIIGCALVWAAGYDQILNWFVLAVVLSVISQAGDLLESSVKRKFGVKDSGTIIPGHGGLMDRVDGLVAAAIGAAVMGLAMGGPLMDPIAGLGL